jgi:hypothetical protein
MTRPIRHDELTATAPLDRRGHRLPETLAAIDRRDMLICEAAVVHFPDLSMNDAAHRLHVALARYESGPWRRERVADVCPPRHAGRLAAHCWQILRERDRTPSARSIRAILGRSSFPCQPSAE